MWMINVIGLGYIGLPTALVLAANGNQVTGTDINEGLVKQLSTGELPFDEQGMMELFSQAKEQGVTFRTKCIQADHYIVTVPTPYDELTKKINPAYILKAVKDILLVCPAGATIIIESTVSPGTIEREIVPLIKQSSFTLEKDIFLAHAPERIIPGNMLEELKNNSRTIGANSPVVAEKVKQLYNTFCTGNIVCTDIKTAEMTKVIENTYRAVNIAFANELLKISNESYLNVYEVIDICNQHPRVNILQPGPGVGGHCIPVDPWFLIGDFPELANLTKCALSINDSMTSLVINKLEEIMKENRIKSYEKVGIYGLTYKPNTDDTRESPSLKLINQLKEMGREVQSYDPMLNHSVTENQIMSFEAFLDKVEVVIVMTDHSDLKLVTQDMTNKIVFDTKNSVEATYSL